MYLYLQIMEDQTSFAMAYTLQESTKIEKSSL